MTPRCRPLFRRRNAVRAVLVLSLLAATCAQAQQAGWLLVGVARRVGDPHDAEVVDLRTGARRPLPIGRTNSKRGTGFDNWSASRASAHTLLRTNNVGDVDFIDSESLRTVASFSLKSISNARAPAFWGTPRLSPDGRYVLAYWSRDVYRDKPELLVLDRSGRIVDEGSPLQYDSRRVTEAASWLPDGRYVYLADDRIVVHQPGTSRNLSAPLRVPDGVHAGTAQLEASPDGHHLALLLGQIWPDSSGESRLHGVLFVSNLDGTNLHQVTKPSPSLQARGSNYSHVNPRWSPDGRWIAFTPRTVNPYGALRYFSPCVSTRMVSAEGGVEAVDDGQIADQRLLKANGSPVTSCSFIEWFD